MGLSSCMDRPMTNPQDEHGQVAAPVITPPPGTYQSSLSITITCATPGASIRYTTDGSEPNEYSSLYSVPVYVGGSTVIKARAYKQGMDTSPVTASQYTLELPTVDTPTFSPPGGTYTSDQTVTINCTTNGASIRYTTNGADPGEASELYTSPILVASTTTIKARAFKASYNPSQSSSATYTMVSPPILVDHFDDLSAWTNTTSGSGAWYLLPGGYSGTYAISNCMDGAGDQLSRTFNFATNVVLKIWVSTDDPISDFHFAIKVDDVNALVMDGDSDWSQKQIFIPSGQHTLSLETGGWHGWGCVDEMEIYTSN